MTTPVKADFYKMRTQIREAIGELCMIWSGIEWMLDLVLAKLLKISEVEASAINQSTGLVSKRCDLILKLCQHSSETGNSIERLISTLIDIQTKLSPMRNRYVHDLYVFGDEGMERQDRRVSFKSLESRMPKHFHFGIRDCINIDDIEAFIGTCMRAMLDLRDFQLTNQ